MHFSFPPCAQYMYILHISHSCLRRRRHHHHHLPSRFRALACSGSENCELMILFEQLVGLLGQGISQTQGFYLHRTTQHRKNSDTHPCPEKDSNLRSQCSSGRSLVYVKYKYLTLITNRHTPGDIIHSR
jgi:hypothetical protein